MKQPAAEKIVFSAEDRHDTLYLAANGLHIRDVVIDAGLKDTVLIGVGIWKRARVSYIITGWIKLTSLSAEDF